MSYINNSSSFNTSGIPQDFLQISNAVDNMSKTDKNMNSSSSTLNYINVFDVLTPQINNIPISSNINEGILIDITNDTDSNQINSKIKESLKSNELRGSLADVKKTEFNLIDLYENIYVTPQQVTKETSCTNSSKEINKYSNNVAVDNYNEYLTYDVRSENILRNTSKPRQYDEIFDKVVSSKNTSINRDDLSMAQNNALNFKSPRFNSISDMRDNSSEDLEDVIQDILHMNIAQNQMLKKLEESTTEKKCLPSIATGNCKKNMNEVPINTEDPRKESLLKKHTNFNDNHFENLYSISNATGRVKMLDTIKKDEKTAKSKKILFHNSCSSNLTKGADLFEKSVVLPQIMERIAERNKRIADKMNQDLRRKLLLDSGNVDYKRVGALNMKTKRRSKKTSRTTRQECNMLPSCSMTTDIDGPVIGGTTRGKVTLSPTVLMENSKIVRLAALDQRRKFESFVLRGKYDK